MHHFLITVLLSRMMRYTLAYALKYTGNWFHSLLQRRGTWWLGFRGRRETFYSLDILLFPLNFITHVCISYSNQQRWLFFFLSVYVVLRTWYTSNPQHSVGGKEEQSSFTLNLYQFWLSLFFFGHDEWLAGS